VRVGTESWQAWRRTLARGNAVSALSHAKLVSATSTRCDAKLLASFEVAAAAAAAANDDNDGDKKDAVSLP